MRDVLLTPVPNKEAATFIANKPVVSRQVFDQLLPDVKARAMVITGVEDANLVQALRDQIADLPRGADWDTLKAGIAEKLSPWLPDEGQADLRGQASERAERRAELLLRTHGFQAYAAGQHEVMARQRVAFPFWQYQTADDDRVRDSHAVLDGLVLPADSPFWEKHFPPWDWGCRCQVIPLQREDVEDIEAEDARKAPEARRVLDPERRRQLETTGILNRALPGDNGLPRPYDVRPPTDRGGSYTFTPSTLRMDAEALRGRYAPDVFASFEAMARRQVLPGGGTVWSWLQGGNSAPPVARPTVTPPPPTQPPAAAPVGPRMTIRVPSEPPPPPALTAVPAEPPRPTAPVSAALEVKVTGRQRGEVKAAIETIDRVHRDGELPTVPITGRAGTGNLGVYTYTYGGKPVSIGINAKGGWPGLTTLHEIGHLLDHQVLGARGEFASAAAPAMSAFREAVLRSQAVAQIRAMGPAQQRYFLSAHELWARSYAQYVTTRSGNPGLKAQLDTIRQGNQPWRQWSDEDFAQIADAIDGIFRAKGWLT